MKSVIAIVALLLCTGCNTFRGAKLWAPSLFDMEPIADRIFVNKEMPPAERKEALMIVTQSKERITKYYGKVISRPKFFFCSTEECFKSFGGSTNRGQSFGDFATLISPRGISVSIVSHEWSHTELYSRIDSIWIMRNIPQWFDEGLAVTVSEAPEFSDIQWQYLVDSNIFRPTRDELYSFKSIKQWVDAVRRYGIEKNIERKARGEPEVAPLYTAAGHFSPLPTHMRNSPPCLISLAAPDI